VNWLPTQAHYCEGCGCREGRFHFEGCEAEVCPVCGQGVRVDCEFHESHADLPRRRFIYWPQVCARCGKLWPEEFWVEQEEWDKYVGKDVVLCWPCFCFIRELQDAAGRRE